MIYLYTLPGINLTYPEITSPLIKGVLKSKGIDSIHIDLTLKFLDFLAKKESFSLIMENIKKNLSFEKRIANSQLLNEELNKFFESYDIKYFKHCLHFKEEMDTINSLVAFVKSNPKSLCVFDNIFEINQFKKDDIIYINVAYDFQLPYALKFIGLIKEKVKVKIVLGGNYLTHIKDNLQELMEKFDLIDAIFYYANYDNLYKIITYFDGRGLNIQSTDSIIRDNGKLIHNNSNLVPNYIEECVPDFSDLQLSKYLSKDVVIPLILTKGCYYGKCNFCAHHSFYKNYQRLNIDKICEFIKSAYYNQNVKGIIFVDECILPEDIFYVANYIIDNQIHIKWMMETRISQAYLSKSNIKLLEKSGCKFITFGVESASQKTLNKMNKGIKFSLAKNVLKSLHESDIIISSTYIIGYSKENKFSMNRTLKFIKDCKYIDAFGLNVFNFVRNSQLSIENKVDTKNTINLIYSYRGENRENLQNELKKFYMDNKINRYSIIRSSLLNRSDYLFFNKQEVSMNKKSLDYGGCL